MRRRSHSLPLLVLSFGLASCLGCKKSPPASDESAEQVEPAPSDQDEVVDTAPPQTDPTPIGDQQDPPLTPPPPPLALLSDVPIIVHLDDPSAALEGLRVYVPQLPEARTLVDAVVSGAQGGKLGSTLVAALDFGAPWDVATADGELIVHVPLKRRRVRGVRAALAELPAAGTFGAVDLQRGAAPGPKLAWLDREAATLTLASTERGLSTGRELATAYGEEPLRVKIDGTEARKYVPDFRFDALTISGAGPHQLEATAEGVSAEILAHFDVLRPGALTGLLETGRIAIGASSKYRDHEQKVRELDGRIGSELERQLRIDSLPSQVRGTAQANLDDFHRRLARVLRHWNGRTLLGVGGKDRLLLALGAGDPGKMRGDFISLVTNAKSKIDSVASVMKSLRSLGVSVPRVELPGIRFAAKTSTVAGQPIAVVVLEDARKYLPAEYAPLLDARGELRVALAFPPRAGAAMVVVGAGAEKVLGPWLEDTAAKTAGKDSLEHVLSATLAVDHTALLPVLHEDADPFSLLALEATRAPTLAVVTRDGTTLSVRVTGPAPK